ncbi:hypothetical protein D3C80_1225130 [compost metagenome]
MAVGQGLHVADLLVDAGDGGAPDLLQQGHGALRRLGHGVVQAHVSVGRVAQQARSLVAQLQDVGDQGLVVVGVAVVAAHDEVGVGQHRIDRGAGVDDGPSPLQPALLGGHGQGVDEGVGQAAQGRAVVDDDPGLFVRQQVAAEGGEFLRQFLADLADPDAARWRQFGAAADEVGAVQPDDALLLGRQVRRLARRLDRLDAGVEGGVLVDGVGMGGEQGLQFGLDGAELGRGQAGRQDAVEGPRPLQRAARGLIGGHGVVEGRGGPVGGDAVDVGQLVLHGLDQGGLQVLDLDLVPRRNAAVRAGPGSIGRVAGQGGGVAHEGHAADRG